MQKCVGDVDALFCWRKSPGYCLCQSIGEATTWAIAIKKGNSILNFGSLKNLQITMAQVFSFEINLRSVTNWRAANRCKNHKAAMRAKLFGEI